MLTVKLPLLHSAITISFMLMLGTVSSSVIVATHDPSPIDAFTDTHVRAILKILLHSYVLFCRVTTRTTPVVAHATIVSVPHV